MKTKQKVALLIFIFSIVAVVGCENNEIVLEITSNSKNAVIKKEVYGIKFKFCLLNENGDSLTVFKQGENIIFSFTFENDLQDSIIVSTDFISPNFYRVYQSDNVDMGKPWTGLWCEFNMAKQELRLAPSSLKQLNCPWILTANSQPNYPLCMSQSKNYLTVGDYYTYIDLGFHYSINNKHKSIDNLKFIINFKVTKN
jgi:hypothetical protein